MKTNLVIFLLLFSSSFEKRTRKRSRRKRNHVIEENIPHGNGFIPMKLYSSKKKGYLCLGEQTIMKWKRCTIQIQHQLEEALKAIPTIDEITFMKPCLPRLNRHVNAIGDNVNSGGKKAILLEKKKKPKIHNIKKPEPDPVAFTEKDPTKEIIDLLTPF